jgi:retinol dehydrogenase 12
MTSKQSVFTWKSTADNVLSVYPQNAAGKHVIVTGGYGGIGYETCRVLAKGGAHVTLLGREEKKLREAIVEIKKTNPSASLDYIVCDLGSFKSIKACAETYAKKNKPIDILINNAGIMGAPLRYTADGFESQMGVNHMGHAYLTRLLLPIIQKSKTSRIINVSSVAHGHAPSEGIYFDNFDGKKGYNRWKRYGHSKLANIYFTRSLERHYPAKETGITSVALHPGVITSTELMRFASIPGMLVLMGMFFTHPSCSFAIIGEQTKRGKTIPQGAATTVYCALSPDIVSGEYYSDSNLTIPKLRYPVMNFNDDFVEKFYDFTNKLIDQKTRTLN